MNRKSISIDLDTRGTCPSFKPPKGGYRGAHYQKQKEGKENRKRIGSEKWKKKREKIDMKSIFAANFLCKGYFFFQLKKNWVISEINYLGIFISILSCKMKGFYSIFLYFENLSFPSFYYMNDSNEPLQQSIKLRSLHLIIYLSVCFVGFK